MVNSSSVVDDFPETIKQTNKHIYNREKEIKIMYQQHLYISIDISIYIQTVMLSSTFNILSIHFMKETFTPWDRTHMQKNKIFESFHSSKHLNVYIYFVALSLSLSIFFFVLLSAGQTLVDTKHFTTKNHKKKYNTIRTHTKYTQILSQEIGLSLCVPVFNMVQFISCTF